jgi:squalene synthase HpnC
MWDRVRRTGTSDPASHKTLPLVAHIIITQPTTSPIRRATGKPLQITPVPAGHYENFPVASLLVPARLREAVGIIYRFARTADDFADEGDAAPSERLASLQTYRSELDRIARRLAPSNPLFEDVARIVRTHALPLEPFYDLLSAFSQDVVKTRYADFEELLDYCRRSANPVGRLMLHLFGAADAVNLPRSDAVCSSLQLINFWQDVAIDWQKDRVYLPLDELAHFGVSEAQIAAGLCDAKWRELMTFQIDRSRSMMETGAPLGRMLTGRFGMEIRITIRGGLAILDKLEAANCDMFRHRPVLRWHDWPFLLMRAL